MDRSRLEQLVKEWPNRISEKFDDDYHFGMRSVYEKCAEELESLLKDSQGEAIDYVRRDALRKLKEDDEITGVMVHVDELTDSIPVYTAPQPTQPSPPDAVQLEKRARLDDAITQALHIADFIDGKCTNEEAGRKALGWFVQYGRGMIAALSATPEPPRQEQGEFPDGWKLVPIEPNWDMRNEGREFLIDGTEKEPEKLAYFLWKIMVAAAPEMK